MSVARTPMYFGPDERPLFGWLHTPVGPTSGDLAAVICAPFGHEAISAHRSLRHLADHLAAAGIPALRFDYDGSGDSAGIDEDSGRVAAWRESIRAAAATVRQITHCGRLALIGLRLGATLAASVASDIEAESVVSWGGVTRGRTHLRELKALYLTTGEGKDVDGTIEPGGFVVTEETQRDLAALQLASAPQSWIYTPFSAPPEMFLPPHSAVLPETEIAAIAAFLSASASGVRHTIALPALRTSYTANGITESIVTLPGGIFGIATEASGGASVLPMILLPNAGSTHHVGPNRLHVFIARALAAAGFPVFRFDLPGLGDSITDQPEQENDPYPENVSATIEAVMRSLGKRPFIVAGLCSGAHAAFHAARELDGDALIESIVINPLTFRYQRGMPLDQPVVKHAHEWQWYMRSMRRMDRWVHLLRGKVSFRQIADTMTGRLRLMVASRGEDLSAHIAAIVARRRQLTFVFSRFDPGHELLMLNARWTVRRLLKTGSLQLQLIEDADHTFQPRASREALIAWLTGHLQARYGTGHARTGEERAALQDAIG